MPAVPKSFICRCCCETYIQEIPFVVFCVWNLCFFAKGHQATHFILYCIMQDGRLLLVKLGGVLPLGIDGGIIDVEVDVWHIQISMIGVSDSRVRFCC